MQNLVPRDQLAVRTLTHHPKPTRSTPQTVPHRKLWSNVFAVTELLLPENFDHYTLHYPTLEERVRRSAALNTSILQLIADDTHCFSHQDIFAMWDDLLCVYLKETKESTITEHVDIVSKLLEGLQTFLIGKEKKNYVVMVRKSGNLSLTSSNHE